MAGAFSTTIERALAAPLGIPASELAGMLRYDDACWWAEARQAADALKRRYGLTATLPRALIETSNVCRKDCLYCGIRRSNAGVRRYRLTHDEVLACVDAARHRGYPALAFQAGEIESEENTAFYERLLRETAGEFEVTLSLGEQSAEVYRRWREAGALRYLLRIETADRGLYSRIHPRECSYDRRVECLRELKRLGYVTGTGVMIGLPGQDAASLAADLVFMGELGADMVGMGPYIPHPAAPLGGGTADALELSLRMITLARLYLHRVNIVAATALSVLDPAEGRQRALAAGANVIMDEFTPAACRREYDLYPGKGASSS